jgi:hypothetical protein
MKQRKLLLLVIMLSLSGANAYAQLGGGMGGMGGMGGPGGMHHGFRS